MLDILLARLKQGHRTVRFPDQPPALPDRFRGAPQLFPELCRDGCRACIDACPTDALGKDDGGLRLDLGRCLFCADCTAACPEGAIRYTTGHRLAARRLAHAIPATATSTPMRLASCGTRTDPSQKLSSRSASIAKRPIE